VAVEGTLNPVSVYILLQVGSPYQPSLSLPGFAMHATDGDVGSGERRHPLPPLSGDKAPVSCKNIFFPSRPMLLLHTIRDHVMHGMHTHKQQTPRTRKKSSNKPFPELGSQELWMDVLVLAEHSHDGMFELAFAAGTRRG